jgi:hypothetical protein
MSLPRLSFSEWCLAIALVLALAAGGWAQAHIDVGAGNLVTGILAIGALVCIALVAASNFLIRPRYQSQTTRYNNVTRLRNNPFRRMMTSWHLLLLKLRYRNKGNRER